ncbi:nucleotidyltransferase domain-containing protein [Pontibacillus yanchengensis]|uniref:Nucleotidyltransferase n=1 Tax=Pontibacillus yanchengensis Y32 TaxID=1385514 RepID=A0A0A2TJ75_9BACI|nr:nucleotidyltransferase domain-containing protein [Pontibacillus yanchengensis]KGP74478.1 nucleotidyltransferase [Pontibacillus yanchengensis Y32]
MNRDILHIARDFIATHFPDSRAALLAGSHVRGEDTPSSDLDIVILDRDTYRKSYIFLDHPIEAFVYNDDSLDFQLFAEQQHGIPLITRMCAEGVVLKGEEEARTLISQGKQHLMEGPNPLSPSKLDDFRYFITDLLYDLEGSTVEMEDTYSVGELTLKLPEFILRANQEWIGEGKWMYRCLKEFDPTLAKDFTKCIQAYYQSNNKQELIGFADHVLEPFGGRLFNGYEK